MISSLLHLVGLRPRVYYTLTNFREGGQGPLGPPPSIRQCIVPDLFPNRAGLRVRNVTALNPSTVSCMGSGVVVMERLERSLMQFIFPGWSAAPVPSSLIVSRQYCLHLAKIDIVIKLFRGVPRIWQGGSKKYLFPDL